MVAGEYVLGTLAGAARRRFARLLKEDATLQAEVARWEARLAGLAGRVEPVAPRELVWANIDSVINLPKVTALPPREQRLASKLNLWRAWAVAASIICGVLGYQLQQQLALPPQIVEVPKIVTVQAPPQAMPYVTVLAPGGDARVLLSVSPEQGLIKASISGKNPVDAQHCLELWVIGDDGKPRSLGVMPGSGDAQMPMPKGMSMPKTPTLALSVEPLGGSPAEGPTGPVVSANTAMRAL